MIIIGLDPGCKTGWAICRDGHVVESGVQTFDLARGESPGMRFLRFRHWLGELSWRITAMREVRRRELQSTEFETVVLAYESSFQRGRHAKELYHGFITRIQELAAERKDECLPGHTATIKKWSCGNGRASKADMIDAARKRLGSGDAPIAEDEADAILIALWAWERIGKILPPAQRGTIF